MHMLTGLMLGEMLLGSRLLRAPRQPVEIVHVLPGRLRARLAGLRGDPHLAERVREDLARVPGVLQAAADHRSGTTLVTFTDTSKARAQIIAALRELARAQEAEPPDDEETGEQTPLLLDHIRRAGRHADRQVMSQSQRVLDARTLLALAAGAWGLKTIAYPGAISRWQGLTLCYWSFNMLQR
jgi:hypothetical protein